MCMFFFQRGGGNHPLRCFPRSILKTSMKRMARAEEGHGKNYGKRRKLKKQGEKNVKKDALWRKEMDSLRT